MESERAIRRVREARRATVDAIREARLYAQEDRDTTAFTRVVTLFTRSLDAQGVRELFNLETKARLITARLLATRRLRTARA